MKLSAMIVLCLAFLLSSCSSTKSVSGFYQAHKREKGVLNFTLPGWLIWLGTGIAHESVKEQEAKVALQLAKKVKRLRFMVMEDKNTASHTEISSLVSNLRKDNFEDLIYVKEGTTTFTFMIREKKDKIRNLFFLVSEDDELVMMEMKSNLRYSDISKLIKQFSKELKIDKPLKKPLPQA